MKEPSVGCNKCGATNIPVVGHEPCPGRPTAETGKLVNIKGGTYLVHADWIPESE